MQSGVTLCIMDISGQNSGTDHVRTRSVEVCQLLQTSISKPIKLCLLNTAVFVHWARETSVTNWNCGFDFLFLLWCDTNHTYYVKRYQMQQLFCVQSMSTVITHGNSFHLSVHPSEHSAVFLSLSLCEEKVKWPHMSQSITSLLSGGWCMRAKMASAETADHTHTRSDTHKHKIDGWHKY